MDAFTVLVLFLNCHADVNDDVQCCELIKF